LKAVRRPLVSADDVEEANYPRARFDGDLAWIIKETARKRAPTEESIWRHRVGFAGELTAAAYFNVEADWSNEPDYSGDDGFDITVGDFRVEVKTVTDEDDWQLKVPVDRMETADHFVLARCTNPSELVKLVGGINRRSPDVRASVPRQPRAARTETPLAVRAHVHHPATDSRNPADLIRHR
jgi:hypothetical protein